MFRRFNCFRYWLLTKTSFNWSEGAKVEYVDPANLVYSYTDSPYFEDIYYVGEVKEIPINELAKEFPHLTEFDLEDIHKLYNPSNSTRYRSQGSQDKNKISLLYFNYKTYMNDAYKIKTLGSGAEKAISRDDSFNPPEGAEDYSKVQRTVECLFEGALVCRYR